MNFGFLSAVGRVERGGPNLTSGAVLYCGRSGCQFQWGRATGSRIRLADRQYFLKKFY